MLTPRQLQERYRAGENIAALLRRIAEDGTNNESVIETAYDLQSGSYIEAMRDPARWELQEKYTLEIAKTIKQLGPFNSLLEPGVGEATTMASVLRHLEPWHGGAFGFDLCWSRVAMAKTWLAEQGTVNARMSTGSLFSMPFADDSIDIIYTSHSLEPNGGKEEELLREVYRVVRHYIVLLEPGYELAAEPARRRMEAHGYVRDLSGICRKLGYGVLDHRLFPISINPLNPTALTIIAKKSLGKPIHPAWACPVYRKPLLTMPGALYSEEGLCVYPIIGEIPCLRPEQRIIASQARLLNR